MSNNISGNAQNNIMFTQQGNSFTFAQATDLNQKVDIAMSSVLNGATVNATAYEEISANVVSILQQPGFDGKNMSIDALISWVMLDRYKVMDEVVREQAKKVETMNKQLSALGRIKADLAAYGTNTSKPNDQVKLKPEVVAEMKELAADAKLDIDWSSINNKSEITQGNLAKLNEILNTMTTTTTNIQSSEYSKLQEFSQKLTQALDLTSAVSKKFADTVSGIIAAIR
jgi:hypothetical protein